MEDYLKDKFYLTEEEEKDLLEFGLLDDKFDEILLEW